MAALPAPLAHTKVPLHEEIGVRVTKGALRLAHNPCPDVFKRLVREPAVLLGLYTHARGVSGKNPVRLPWIFTSSRDQEVKFLKEAKTFKKGVCWIILPLLNSTAIE